MPDEPSEPNETPRRYKWPWFLLAAVVLFIVLAIVWMSVAVHREREERGFDQPVPAGSR
ncbi:MAG TPA: hypothetical protein VFY06_07675 [Verrucomicrobiae bacterium]|nr:hypothetical protein [Verrucomicrobiae bacterium]